MNENAEIAKLLFPDVTGKVEEYFDKYPPRKLPKGAAVTRFGPSPTGFLHIGGLFAALVSERIAHQSDGVFFLRIEDTDKNREVEHGIDGITNALSQFNIKIDEGVHEGGEYGPYKQNERKDIYAAFAKHLVEVGRAYPCFCSPEELDAARKKQEEQKIRPGYYGEWAVHRNITPEEIQKNIEAGKPFVIRLRAEAAEMHSPTYNDLVKGEVSITENDNDIILLKSDKLPTYHLAHVVDDHLMGTTHVIRGDEWLSSLPIHLQLFGFFGFDAPHFAHLSPILKSEGGNKRKLSKRKDPEAAIDYYAKEGYPDNAVIEYLLNIANSDFEPWRKENPTKPYQDFVLKLEKFNKSGALFDLTKLTDVSKEVIAKMSAEEVYKNVLVWAETYDKPFADMMKKEKDYFLKIFGIERGGDQPRKDFSKWSEVKENISYFFEKPAGTDMPQGAEEILKAYVDVYDPKLSKDDWFNALKDFAEQNGYARDMKTHKQDPGKFKGTVGDVAMILRVALTGKNKTPDLYQIMQVLGEKTVKERFQR